MSEVRNGLEVQEAIEQGEDVINKALILLVIQDITERVGKDAKYILQTLLEQDLVDYWHLQDDTSKSYFLADRTARNFAAEEDREVNAAE